jgi:hypothetical protein
MTAKAAKDTAIAGTRFEAPGSVISGCLPPWSGVSATCVPLRGRSSNDSRAIAHPNRLKSWAYMVNDRLFLAVSRSRRSLLKRQAPSRQTARGSARPEIWSSHARNSGAPNSARTAFRAKPTDPATSRFRARGKDPTTGAVQSFDRNRRPTTPQCRREFVEGTSESKPH